MRIGFVGASYTARSTAVADEECINLFAETVESQGSVVPNRSYGGSGAQGLKSYFGTPGLKAFANLPLYPLRGTAWADNRLFAVAGSSFIELAADGTQTFRYSIPNDGGLVSIAVSNTELLIVSAGTAWCYRLGDNSIVEVTSLMAGVPVKVEFSDGYFIVMFKNSNLFQMSDVLDGATWPGIQVNEVSVFPEDITSIIVDHRELWVFGQQHAHPYQNTGSDEIFDVIPGTLIEKGCITVFSTCRLDNSVFWIDQDERGSRSAWRAQGYTPVRVPTHAVEFDLAGYDALTVPDTVIQSFDIAYLSQPPNQLGNSDFQNGAAGWVFEPGWVLGEGGSDVGAVAAFTGPGTSAVVNLTHLACTPGGVINASVWSLGEPGATGNAQLRMTFYDASDTQIGGIYNSVAAIPDYIWRQQGLTEVAPAAASYAIIDYAVYSSTSAPRWFVHQFYASAADSTGHLSVTFRQTVPASLLGNVFSFSGLTAFPSLNGTSDTATAIDGNTVTFSRHDALGALGNSADTGVATTQQVVLGNSGLVSYAYQDQGHIFWVLYVPGSQWSWVYDVAESLWHKRAALLPDGTWEAHRSWNHVFAYGKHLVGDWKSGILYDMNLNWLDDDGTPIRRLRRAPTVIDEMQWIMHADLTVDFDTGLGPTPPLLDGSGNPRPPQATLRWSDNRGKTWSSAHVANCGLAGEFNTRVIWRRLGRSRYRVYELSMTDKVPWVLVDSYLNIRT